MREGGCKRGKVEEASRERRQNEWERRLVGRDWRARVCCRMERSVGRMSGVCRNGEKLVVGSPVFS